MSGMPRPPGSSDPDLWTLDLPASQDTSVGSMGGVSLYGDGTSEKNRENEDRYYTCKFEGVQLYMVLDGHHGSRACEFAMKRIPSLLLRYNMGESGEKAAEALKYAFENTEKNFFMMLDPSITRKMGLQLEMQEQGGTTSMLAFSMFPDKVEELQRLEEQIKGGTTAVVALILNNRHLWVANVGDSRAVLCYLDGNNKLHTEQISEDHNTKNEKEIMRLVACGLDEVRLRNSGRLGMHQNTRSIGDYSIKGGYKDHDILSVAVREPGIAEPFISHPPLDITTIRGFLLLMSDGLYDAYMSVSNSAHTVNHDIALLVQRYMDQTHNIDGIAQRVIAEVSNNFHTVVRQDKRSARLDDITLVIRNLGYPMGQLASTVTAPPTLQNPFDFSQQQLPPAQARVSYENSEYLLQHQQSVVNTSSHSPYTRMPISTASGYAAPSRQSFTQIQPAQTGHAPPLNLHGSMYDRQPAPLSAHPATHHTLSDPYGASTVSMRKSESDSKVNQMPPGTQGMYEQSYMYPPPATGPGYGQPYHTNADSRLGAFHISPHPSTSSVPNYENVELGKTADWNRDRTVTSTSAGNVAEVASRVGAMQINSNPNPHASREVTPTLTSVPPISTNAESQYQTSQQVLPPPLATQPSVSQHVVPNSVPSRPSTVVSTSGTGSSHLLRKGSTFDDESWMYNQDQDTAETPMNAPQQTWGEGVGQEKEEKIIGESGVGEVDLGNTEVIELLMPTDEPEDVSGDEEEEEDGMIKPIIKFDKFPLDLSWDEI